MKEILVCFLLYAGAAFMLLAALGIVRMPDLYVRMQATTKATTLGIGLLTAAVALHLSEAGAWARAAGILVFFFLTAPVAAHVIARAAYFVGIAPWDGTVTDELRGRYDAATHELASRKKSGA